MNVTILYGSETGNAESLADDAGKALNGAGISAVVKSMADVTVDQFPQMDVLLIITSTWGDGEPPSNGYDLHYQLGAKTALDIQNMRFAVLALGDTAYPEFCKCGKDFDEWLDRLGAKRLLDRVDCDLDFEGPFATWIADVQRVLQPGAVPA